MESILMINQKLQNVNIITAKRILSQIINTVKIISLNA